MKKYLLVCLAACALSGCHWFIDARAKRAVSIVSNECTIAIEQATEQEKASSCYRSLLRMQPALENLTAYVYGKKPMAEEGKK